MTLTIQQAIDTIIASIPGAPFSETVDTVKVGDTSQEITGIAVTFLANCDAIEQAAGLGANLLITHEPTFYNHLDQTDWLTDHPLYARKRQLIEEKNLVIWRFHDYLHSLPPDRTLMGLMKELGWNIDASPELPFICTIEPMSLRSLGQYVKEKLGVTTIRVVGDLESQCERVALYPGFPPATWQMGSLAGPGADVVLTGEIHEWEISEYVRDATHLGLKKGLIVMGHMASEEPGMRLIVTWLQERLPDIPIQFISSGSAFHYL